MGLVQPSVCDRSKQSQNLRMKFFTLLALVLACANCVRAHTAGCSCGSPASPVCQKHQWMFWGIIGLMATYLYMYAGYLWQAFCQKVATVLPTVTCDENCGHHHCDDCDHGACCGHVDCGHAHGTSKKEE